jgi:hypothetical protein
LATLPDDLPNDRHTDRRSSTAKFQWRETISKASTQTQPSLIRKIGALQVYLRRAAARAGNLHEQWAEAAFVELKAGLPAALRI